MDGSRSDFSDMNRKLGDILRRCNRITDGPMTRKKLVMLVLVSLILFLYVGPFILRWIFNRNEASADSVHACLSNFVSPFEESRKNYDSYVRHENEESLSNLQNNFVPYIGNGLLGLSLEADSHLYIKHRRTLSLPVFYHPLFVAKKSDFKEVTVTEYTKGMVHRFQCDNTLRLSYQYYAHRTIPHLLVQEIRLHNPTDSEIIVDVSTPRVSYWPSAVKQILKLHHGNLVLEYEAVTGMIDIPNSDKVIAVSVVGRKLPNTATVFPQDTAEFHLFTTIPYSEPIRKEDYASHKDKVEKQAIDSMERVLALVYTQSNLNALREAHTNVWRQLWFTGFTISDSKAAGVVNGDKVNATMYAVLSQARSYESENSISVSRKSEIVRSLTYSEGCYEGHSTLEALNLWKPLDSVNQITTVTGAWLLTLEKQGCHNLLKAGASGVNQALVLSLGSLRFSNQHLEYNIHPSKLHRDFVFRRLNYGNMTHVNITVTVQDDNKAALYVALDRSDRNYYACDAGCLDDPVQLGPSKRYFPVKLTEPLTAILYVTSDKEHMEDLRHAIHVQGVVEAPAHEQHVLAMHRHGSGLGTLPPIFWITICVLIILFHLFLCRIIMAEYCDNNSYRRLYNKP